MYIVCSWKTGMVEPEEPLNTEVEESGLFGAVTKQRLAKANWDILARTIVNRKICRLPIALQLRVIMI
jgi:hypothetical protein